MPPTEPTLAELKALAEKATFHLPVRARPMDVAPAQYSHLVDADGRRLGALIDTSDCVAIAAACNVLPALIRRVEAAEQIVRSFAVQYPAGFNGHEERICGCCQQEEPDGGEDDLSWHLPSCDWLAARRWSDEHPAPPAQAGEEAKA